MGKFRPFIQEPGKAFNLIPNATNATAPRFGADGTILATYAAASIPPQAGVYDIQSNTWTALGGLGGTGPQGQLSDGLGANTRTYQRQLTGRAWSVSGGPSVAYLYQEQGPMQSLVNSVPGKNASGSAVTSATNGAPLVTGWQEMPDGLLQGAVWIGGNQQLIVDEAGKRCGQGTRIVADFGTIGFGVTGAGDVDGRPWIKYNNEPAKRIGPTPPTGLVGVIADWTAEEGGLSLASLIVGSYRDAAGSHTGGFIGNPWPNNLIPLHDFAIERGVSVPAGFEFNEPRAATGSVIIVGVGALNGTSVGWVLSAPYCHGAYCDCNTDCEQNIDDFICFQTFFALGDLYADCDGSGVLDINDFICFQTFYALGCD